ncbi:hypothetical protein ABPG75_008625 [Micractinium tetrahymenae]
MDLEGQAAALEGKAAALDAQIEELKARAAAKRRRAAGLRWQARVQVLLARRPGNARSLLVRLVEADMLLPVVACLEAVEDRVCLASCCQLLLEAGRRAGDRWLLCSSKPLAVACSLRSAPVAEKLSELLGNLLQQLPLTEVALRFGAAWRDQGAARQARLMLTGLALSFLPRLAELRIVSEAEPGCIAEWELPRSTSLRGLQLWMEAGSTARCTLQSIEVLGDQQLPSLQWAELAGLMLQGGSYDAAHGFLPAVCASTQLTRLCLERCDLSPGGMPGQPAVPANALAAATSLRHLELREVGLPPGWRQSLTALHQLTALHLPAPGGDEEPLETLAPLTALRQLSLAGTDCSVPVLACLPTGLTSLRLDFTGHPYPVTTQMAYLEDVSSLQQLWLGPAARIPFRAAARLCRCIPGLVLELA